MATNETRPTDAAIIKIDADLGLPVGFDDTRLRLYIKAQMKSLLDELIANGEVTVNLTSTAVTVDVNGTIYNGTVTNPESKGGIV